MAEYIQLTTGERIAVDRDGDGNDHQYVKLTIGGVNSFIEVDDSNPLPVDSNGIARNANPTPLSNGSVAGLYADLLGRSVHQPWVPRELVVHGRQVLTDTTETTIISAVASTFFDVVGIIVANTSATATAVHLRDSSAGTIRLTVPAAASGGGAAIMLPIQLTQAAANNDWTVQASTGVTSLYVTVLSIAHPG